MGFEEQTMVTQLEEFDKLGPLRAGIYNCQLKLAWGKVHTLSNSGIEKFEVKVRDRNG